MISQEEFYKIVDSLYKSALLNFPQIKNKTFNLFYQPVEFSKTQLYSINVRENYLIFHFKIDNDDYYLPPQECTHIIYHNIDNIKYLEKLYNFLIEVNLLENVFNIIFDKTIKFI